MTGRINVVLKIDGAVNATRDVTLAAGASDRVEFPVRAAAAGSFAVNVGDLSGTLTVAQAAVTPPQRHRSTGSWSPSAPA